MEDEYESLSSSSPTSHHMIAGSMAGILEHSFVYPLDSIKTRLMCLQPVAEANYTGVIDGFKKMVAREGFSKSWRGISAVVVGAGPAHALYFSAYEKIKTELSNERHPYMRNFAYGFAGAGATMLHDGIMTPADAVKQRMQVYASPYRSSWDCLSRVLQREGLRSLYRAYGTQLTMTVPHHMTHVTVYELTHDYANPQREYRPLVHVGAGALGGAAAALLTTPLDVCKTVINTQNMTESSSGDAQPKARGLISAAKTVYNVGGGSSAFFRGASARVLFTMPGTAISWSVYEFFKHSLGQKQQQASNTEVASATTPAVTSFNPLAE